MIDFSNGDINKEFEKMFIEIPDIISKKFEENIKYLQTANSVQTLNMFSEYLRNYLINSSSDMIQNDFKCGWIQAIDTIQKILELYANEVRNASNKEKCI